MLVGENDAERAPGKLLALRGGREGATAAETGTAASPGPARPRPILFEFVGPATGKVRETRVATL